MDRILICDDERDIVNALRIYLTAEGYEVTEAFSGKEAVKKFAEEPVDLVLMDVMMPEMDGISAMTRIRELSNVPVILLTAKSEDTDKILGLNLGADDYVTKPFNPVELVARVRSHLRRYTTLGGAAANGAADIYVCGGIELNDRTKEVSVDGAPVPLTPTEFKILRLLLQNPGTVLSPREIYRIVWSDAPYGAENTVAVHIRHLREKIEIDPTEPRYLKVVWGKGYKIEERPL